MALHSGNILAASAICTLLIWASTIAAAIDAGSIPKHFYGPFINEL
jgi:hypothetical protein